MNKVVSKIWEELGKMLPPTIYFFVGFHVIALVHNLMLRGAGMSPTTSVSILVASLVLGKVVLVADMLPFINRYPEKPLAYNIVWKTAIYTVVSLLFHYLEHLIEFWRKTGNLGEANRKLLDEIVWPRFAAIQILLVSMICVYCVAREVTRVFGAQRIKELFFGHPGKPA